MFQHAHLGAAFFQSDKSHVALGVWVRVWLFRDVQTFTSALSPWPLRWQRLPRRGCHGQEDLFVVVVLTVDVFSVCF